MKDSSVPHPPPFTMLGRRTPDARPQTAKALYTKISSNREERSKRGVSPLVHGPPHLSENSSERHLRFARGVRGGSEGVPDPSPVTRSLLGTQEPLGGSVSVGAWFGGTC